VATGVLIALLVLGTATAAGAHPSGAKWWQYDRSTWQHPWRDCAKYRSRDHRWHRHHPKAAQREVRAKHHRLRDHYRGRTGPAPGSSICRRPRSGSSRRSARAWSTCARCTSAPP